MVLTRREFLRGSVAVLGGAVLSGCKGDKESSRDRSWRTKISTLQNNAGPEKDGTNYIPNQGYVYDIELEGKKVHVNLASSYFERRDHALRYTIGDTSVCVFGNNRVIVENKNNAIINDTNAIQQATELTDLVLNALIDKQNRLIKERGQRYEAAVKRATSDLTYK